jgi:hypothetical protein
MVLCLGAISNKVCMKFRESKQTVLLPLLKCHIQSTTILKMKRDDEEEPTILLIPNKTFTEAYLRNILIKLMAKTDLDIAIIKRLDINLKATAFSIPLDTSTSVRVDVSKGLIPCDAAVSGVVWTTLQLNGFSSEEYWLVAKEINISQFLIAYLAEKPFMKNGDFISYQATQHSSYVFNGQAKVKDLKIQFSQVVSLPDCDF